VSAEVLEKTVKCFPFNNFWQNGPLGSSVPIFGLQPNRTNYEERLDRDGNSSLSETVARRNGV
jgi:hypothetical protein